MVKHQSVRQSVNKSEVIGFNIVTSDATSTAVIALSDITALGYSIITDIHLKCTGDDGWLGLGKAAAAITSGNTAENILPVFQDAFFSQENCRYTSINLIRTTNNVTVIGYVVVQ